MGHITAKCRYNVILCFYLHFEVLFYYLILSSVYILSVFTILIDCAALRVINGMWFWHNSVTIKIFRPIIIIII